MSVRLARDAAEALERWLLGPADPRAYAALRIGYALTALAVTVDLLPLREHLLASDLPPREDPLFPYGTPLNVFGWVSSPAGVSVVALLAAVASVSLALGLASRLSALVVYLWVLSYSSTAVVALAGYDTVLRVVGFVLLVSPQPKVWAVGSGPPVGETPAYGLRIVQWQVMLIYASTVWLKAPDHFWRSGEVLAYFWMSLFARAPHAVFAEVPVLSAFFTYGTLVIEATVPFLLWQRRTRWLGVVVGVSLHLVIAATAKLALFSLAMLALYPAFFEAADFDRVHRWLRPARQPAVAK